MRLFGIFSCFIKTVLHVSVLKGRCVSFPGNRNFDVKIPTKSTNVPQGIWCWLLFDIPSPSFNPKSLVSALELFTDIDVSRYANKYWFVSNGTRKAGYKIILWDITRQAAGCLQPFVLFFKSNENKESKEINESFKFQNVIVCINTFYN